MSAGCLCVHPNYAALPETAANMTTMYQWDEDVQIHANRAHRYLESAIEHIKTYGVLDMTLQIHNTNNTFNWLRRQKEWIQFLSSF